MKDLYRFHDPEEYSCIKKRLFSFSVVADAINIVHAAIEEEIAGYLTKTYNGEYKNTSFQDTDEAIVVSLYTRAKSALLNRSVIRRKPVKGFDELILDTRIEELRRSIQTVPGDFEAKLKPIKKDVVNEFENELYMPPESEQMKFPND